MYTEARKDPAWALLQTIPYLGPVRVALLVACRRLWRFRTKRHLWAYVGFAVLTRTSAAYAMAGARAVRRRPHDNPSPEPPNSSFRCVPKKRILRPTTYPEEWMASWGKAALRKNGYKERSVKKRIEAFFLANVGCIATREQIREAAKDPETGKIPENWHQRLSELRVDNGYSILSWRDSKDLRPTEYVLESAKKRDEAFKRRRPASNTWKQVLERAGNACEWNEAGTRCGLHDGELDPVGGGTVRLSADHKRPHSADAAADINDPNVWQALCPRHQVVKKHFYDHLRGSFNVQAIVQAAPRAVKEEVYQSLKRYFGEA